MVYSEGYEAAPRGSQCISSVARWGVASLSRGQIRFGMERMAARELAARDMARACDRGRPGMRQEAARQAKLSVPRVVSVILGGSQFCLFSLGAGAVSASGTAHVARAFLGDALPGMDRRSLGTANSRSVSHISEGIDVENDQFQISNDQWPISNEQCAKKNMLCVENSAPMSRKCHAAI